MSAVQRLFALKTIACMGAGWLALSLCAPARAAPADPVVNLRAGLIAQAKTGWPPAETALEPLIARDFDVAAITHAVLGDQAGVATPAQTRRLSRALTLKLEQEISRGRAPSADDGFTVVGSQPSSGGDWLVTTRTNPPKAAAAAAGAAAPQPVTTVWRVHAGHGGTKIVDTVRQGISSVQLQHDDFAGALRGRDLDAVIALFETRATAKPVTW